MINPNMALRLLIYIARVYEKIIDDKKIYASKPIPLPRPEFFVLYNGVSPYPDEKILKLSDVFESVASLGIPETENPSLELEARVINNLALQGEVVDCAFVGKVREREEGLEEGREEIARNALAEGVPVEIVQKITGLDTETVRKIITQSPHSIFGTNELAVR